MTRLFENIHYWSHSACPFTDELGFIRPLQKQSDRPESEAGLARGGQGGGIVRLLSARHPFFSPKRAKSKQRFGAEDCFLNAARRSSAYKKKRI